MFVCILALDCHCYINLFDNCKLFFVVLTHLRMQMNVQNCHFLTKLSFSVYCVQAGLFFRTTSKMANH